MTGRDRTGPALVLLGAAVAVVVLLAAGGLMFGVRGDADQEPTEEAGPRAVEATTAPTSVGGPSPPTTSTRGFPGLGPEVPLVAPSPGELPPALAVSPPVEGGEVVPVVATGFGADVDGTARQCARARSERACTPTLPVRFDGTGRARFLFPITARPGGATDAVECGAAVACTLELRDARGIASSALLAFPEARVDAPTVRVDRTTADPGAPVTVEVTGLTAREPVTVAQCAVDDEVATMGCGAPGPEVATRADADGVASVELPLRAGRVGANIAVACDRQTTCAVAILHADGLVRAAPVEVRLSAGPSADYDGLRLGIGLLVALVLAAAAVVLGVRTDWRGAPDPFA